ncbi:MAG: chromosomal replication initiator protein DnaA [Candidatus Latescibacteria bacterium]|nr:chromosomal replication initiator protein DnaA [bacterium]MBD3425428.1 chromosomal replication initiator protein DnaA [Candidatus Latescibacterota bacterium]
MVNGGLSDNSSESRAEEVRLAELWGNILGRISTVVNAQTFQTWFEPMKISGFTGDTLIIEGPNPFFIDWVYEHHIDKIRKASRAIIGTDVDVEFTASGSHARVEQPAVTNSYSPPAEQAPRNCNSIKLNDKYTFEEFVVGEGNRLTHAAAKAVAEKPARAYSPLFIYGGAGLGKTHLIQAIGHFSLRNHRARAISYVSAESFMNELIYAIQKGETLKFKEKYRSTDTLLLDDVHFLAGKESTQEEFFHTFNALHDGNKQIVMTSDRPPKEIPKLQKRLSTRFEWGLITDIQPPSLETRIAILRNKIRNNRIDIPEDVIIFIAEHIKSNIRELEGSLTKLLAYSSVNRVDINMDMAEKVLTYMVSSNRSAPVTISAIIKAVSDMYDIPVSKIRSRSRVSQVVAARQIGIFIARELTDSPLVRIGKKFGGRDHSTVLYAIRKIESKRETDQELESRIQTLLSKLSP